MTSPGDPPQTPCNPPPSHRPSNVLSPRIRNMTGETGWSYTRRGDECLRKSCRSCMGTASVATPDSHTTRNYYGSRTTSNPTPTGFQNSGVIPRPQTDLFLVISPYDDPDSFTRPSLPVPIFPQHNPSPPGDLDRGLLVPDSPFRQVPNRAEVGKGRPQEPMYRSGSKRVALTPPVTLTQTRCHLWSVENQG